MADLREVQHYDYHSLYVLLGSSKPTTRAHVEYHRLVKTTMRLMNQLCQHPQLRQQHQQKWVLGGAKIVANWVIIVTHVKNVKQTVLQINSCISVFLAVHNFTARL